MDKNIYLLGGVPTVGKTIVAQKLSENLGIQYVSTDTLRAWAIEMVGREEYFKELPNEVDLKVEAYLGNQTPEQIFNREVAKNDLMSRTILAFIKANWVWDKYIIEGTGIQPELVLKLKENHNMKPIFLVYDEKDLIKERIYDRGLWSEPEKYDDNYKEKEVEWVWLYNEYLKSESKSKNILTVVVDKLSVQEIVDKIV